MSLNKRGPTYAAPSNRDHLKDGVFLVALRGAPDRDTPRHRQQVFDHLMEQFEQGLPPFDGEDCFLNGLSEQDLIYIPPSSATAMSKSSTKGSDTKSSDAKSSEPKSADTQSADTQSTNAKFTDSKSAEQAEAEGTVTRTSDRPPSSADAASEAEAVILAANEILDLAKLRVALASAFREAQQYKDLVFKIVNDNAGHLSEEECEIVSQKNFAKSIRGLAEARVKITQWYENSSGNHELILNELSFMNEEIAETLAIAEQNGKSTN